MALKVNTKSRAKPVTKDELVTRWLLHEHGTSQPHRETMDRGYFASWRYAWQVFIRVRVRYEAETLIRACD